MKTRWLLAFVALTAMALACYTGLEKRSWTTITSITVLPPTGEKDFSLEVKYQYTWDREWPNAEIYCMYTSPSGNTTPIGTIVPAGLDRDRESFSKVEILTFTVKPKDGKIEPGTYIAGCATEHESSMVTNTFTVTAAATPTPEPPSQPVATPTATL